MTMLEVLRSWLSPLSHSSRVVPRDRLLRRALQEAGVEFIEENGGGAGVRLRKPGGKKPKS
jgi:hypothetical protein